MKNKNPIFPLLFALSIILSSPSRAQDVTLQASVDRTRVEVGEQIQFTVVVEAAQMRGLPQPHVPTPAGLHLSGSSSSTSMSVNFVNGAMATKRTTTYVFSFSRNMRARISSARRS